MNLGALRLRAIGPPLAVAAVSVVALVWFDRIWIPAQQQYVNERNLRAMRTISAQIKAKVNNFDQAIDHAIDSFPIENGNVDLLQKYVKLFSPELEIVTFDPEHPEWTKVTPGDPPNVKLLRDEGHNYLYLGYRHERDHRGKGSQPVTLTARADIDLVTAPSLTRSDFDALLLLDAHGATIAQQSSSGLELTSMAQVGDRGASGAPGHSGVFEHLRGTTSLAVITIGAADYMLYTQPVQLSLVHEAKDATQAPEEWTLCGLLRLDRFRAASSTIPTTYWLCFGAVLALLCFAMPLLKLRVLSPRERLTRADSVSIAAAIFMLMALATFTAQDVRTFGALMPAAVDEQLQSVATSMVTHVRLETSAVARQMTAFEQDDVWQERLGYRHETHHNLAEIREHLEPNEGADINLSPDASRRSQCKPSWSCRSGVLKQLGALEYPFFKMMVWSDDAGWQRIKWSTTPVVTPFINVAESKAPYFASLKLARRLSLSHPDVPLDGVTVMTSPNTGEKLTVFWRSLLPVTDALRPSVARPDLTGVTMATAPISLTSPVLPKNVQFAVVDRSGRVLFHTDLARSLAENMFQECEDSPALKSLVVGRDSGYINARYLGRAHRLFVTPLDAAPFSDPRWSLVVFQAAAVSETVNLETLILATSLFVVYALGLAAVWAVLGLLWPGAIRRLLWPASAKGGTYRGAAVVGTAAGLICMGAPALATPATLVPATATVIACALIAMFVIVHAGPAQSLPSSTWPTDFFWARASLLFLLAAAPATLCFHVAYGFHAELAAKRGESHLASELGARARHINAQAQRVGICTETDPGSQACPGIGDFVARRTKTTLWDVDVPATQEPHRATSDAPLFPAALGSFMRRAYRPYNDLAADLLMTSASHPGQGLEKWRLTTDADGRHSFTSGTGSSGWRFVPAIAPSAPLNGVTWLMAAILMAIAYALVRYLLRPIFALDVRPMALVAKTPCASDANLLVLGPSDSRRSERLQGNTRVRIFDVRSLSFADDPVAAAVGAFHVNVSTAADCGHADHPSPGWPEAIQMAAADPSTIVAVDHLEHRLDDPGFRGPMLECLESLVYRHGAPIWCSSARDPIELLEELGAPERDRRRWADVLEGFRREYLGLGTDSQRSSALAHGLQREAPGLEPGVRSLIVSECEVAPDLLTIAENLVHRLAPNTTLSSEDALAEIESDARPFYGALWRACATDERVALRQLAEEGLVNPNNRAAIARMLSAGLVRRGQTFQVMNETFRRFVIGAASHDVVSAWEREGVRVPWGTIATTGVTVAFGLAGLLLLTQEQLVDAWISYVPALAPAIPTVWKVLASAQKGRVGVTA